MNTLRHNATRLFAAIFVILLLLAPSGLGAQQVPPATRPHVEIRGASDVAVDRRLARLLAGSPTILSADTTLTPADTIRGSVLILDATLVLEGVITGDLVMVDAGAFVRPNAVVGGDLVNIGGGLYRSELARVGGTILDLPTASYRVAREPDALVIVASDAASPFQLEGFSGLLPPTYDRVNGLTAIVGARYTLPMIEQVTPSIHGQAGWRTELGEPTYGLSAELRRYATTLHGGYFRGWYTNDDWIRGDFTNSRNYFWDGDDLRDYFEAKQAWIGVRHELGDVKKTFHATVDVRGQVEDATSLPGDDPWHLLSGDLRPNPAIDPGRTTSIIAGMDVLWQGLQTHFDGRVEYEGARTWLDGDFGFDRVAVFGDWAMHAFADHTVEIEFFVQHPLGGGVMPRQEWSFVGGSSTLRTAELARYTGDRVVFVESKYIVPFPARWALPFVGAPDFQLIHAAGMAWTGSDSPPFRQEMGARLQFFALYLRYLFEPADPSNNKLDIGLSWPFGTAYPWER